MLLCNTHPPKTFPQSLTPNPESLGVRGEGLGECLRQIVTDDAVVLPHTQHYQMRQGTDIPQVSGRMRAEIGWLGVRESEIGLYVYICIDRYIDR